MTSSYEIRQFAPGDRGPLEDMYRAVYGEVWREKTNFRWTFDEPLAAAGAAVAAHNGQVVAAQPYCDLPLHMTWGSGWATLLLDVATHPAHQRRGLFRRVVDVATAAAFARGASIVITTPNRVAARGFERMPGWVQLFSLDCLFLPMGAGESGDGGALSAVARCALAGASLVTRAAAARRRDVTGSRQDEVSTHCQSLRGADELWRRAAPHVGIAVARTEEFMRWRYGPEYRLFLQFHGTAPVGYAAARVVTRGGVKLGFIVDCLPAEDPGLTVGVLIEAARWMQAQGASAVVGYFRARSGAWSCARQAGFLRIPPRLAPRPYPVYVAVPLAERHRQALLDPTAWHMSLSDSDLM